MTRYLMLDIPQSVRNRLFPAVVVAIRVERGETAVRLAAIRCRGYHPEENLGWFRWTGADPPQLGQRVGVRLLHLTGLTVWCEEFGGHTALEGSWSLVV